MSIDERDLAEGLRALSAAPPAAPPARAERVVRRARAMRRNRALGSVALVLLVALPVAGVLLRPAPRRPQPPAASYTDWPDLRNPRWAVAAQIGQDMWRTVFGPDWGVRWLYADRVPGTGRIAAAWAVCGAPGCSEVVLADADAAAPATNWQHHVGSIDPAAPGAPLSWLERSTTGRTVLFVLPRPGTRSVTYSSPALRPGTGGTGTLAARGGAFAADLGYLSAPVTIQVDGVPYAVGVPGLAEAPVGVAPPLAYPVLPAPYHYSESAKGQVGPRGERMTNLTPPVGEWYVVYARCEGTTPMRVTWGSSVRTLPCDGVAREAALEHRRRAPGRFEIDLMSKDPYTSYAWTFGTR